MGITMTTSVRFHTLRNWLNMRWGWVVTLGTFFLHLSQFGFLHCFGLFFVAFRNEFNSSATTTAWIGSLGLGLTATAGVVVNPLLSLLSNHTVAVVGVLLCFSACLITSFMNNVNPMIFTFGLMYGLGLGFSSLAGCDLTLRYFPKRHCSRATSLAVTGASAGTLVLSPVIFRMNRQIGWRNTFRIVGSINLLVGLITTSPFHKPAANRPDDKSIKSTAPETECALKLVDPNEGTIRGDSDTTDHVNGQTAQKRDGIRERMVVLTYIELWIIGLAMIACSMTNAFYYVNLVDFILYRGLTERVASIALILMGISEVAGKLILSGVADILPFPRIFLFPIACMIGIAVLMCFTFLKITSAIVFALTAVLGLIPMTTVDALSFSICHQVFSGDKRMSDAWMFIMIMQGIGFMTGSFFGESIDQTDSYEAAIFGCVGVYVLSSLLWLAAPVYQAFFAPHRFVMFKHQAECRRPKIAITGMGVESLQYETV